MTVLSESKEVLLELKIKKKIILSILFRIQIYIQYMYKKNINHFFSH